MSRPAVLAIAGVSPWQAISNLDERDLPGASRDRQGCDRSWWTCKYLPAMTGGLGEEFLRMWNCETPFTCPPVGGTADGLGDHYLVYLLSVYS